MFAVQWVPYLSEFLLSSMFAGRFSYLANNFHVTVDTIGSSFSPGFPEVCGKINFLNMFASGVHECIHGFGVAGSILAHADRFFNVQISYSYFFLITFLHFRNFCHFFYIFAIFVVFLFKIRSKLHNGENQVVIYRSKFK